MSIITSETRQLVDALEVNPDMDSVSKGAALAGLVKHVAERCADPELQQRYQAYSRQPGSLEAYPLDEEGYAVAFDPLEDEDKMYQAWQRYGVVVSRNVVPEAVCAGAVGKVRSTLEQLSGGSFDIDKPESYGNMPVDPTGEPILTRGFFEVYHDDALAQLRQSVRLYLHHVVLWGQADLWTTFDRYGVKLPGHAESAALPLHVDQNPNIHADFTTTQGVLALEDCPVERGTLVVAPGSKRHFAEYGRMALNKGEYVELDTTEPIADDLAQAAKPLPLRAGNIVTWDSRTTHANSANLSDKTRYIALISAGPARSGDQEAVMAREEAFATGIGSNVRTAMMHASRRPRYYNPEALQAIRRPEQLSLLGKLLYGQVEYDEI